MFSQMLCSFPAEATSPCPAPPGGSILRRCRPDLIRTAESVTNQTSSASRRALCSQWALSPWPLLPRRIQICQPRRNNVYFGKRLQRPAAVPRLQRQRNSSREVPTRQSTPPLLLVGGGAQLGSSTNHIRPR